ncbi:MAG: PQQ-dependent sugar dehydrogenase [Burkholderiales bacterium]|nr:PQQ-dependent sugar dehydrogenase [Phycisphaerae bacterium]
MSGHFASAGLLAIGLIAPTALAQDYRIERIASGLNQPTFITQAPGDPANILYYAERTESANAGFNTANQMGKIIRYDVNTRTKTTVLNLNARSVIQDTGLQNFAFSPDFNAVGTPGFGKMYVSSATNAANAINRVEEYTVSGNSASLTRTILQYNNSSTGKNHTVNWIGFNPAATGPARHYLHISTGDGNAGQTSRPSQNPTDIQGKMLRVDVSPGDSYGADANKNFLIPANNPIPSYNAANPGAPVAGLGEVYMTGLRNISRASFDRNNGDLYLGDVGENSVEELDFIKSGSTTASGLPIDLGWPKREGMNNGWTSPFQTTNTITGVASTNPIRQFGHTTGGNAIIGGYRYRGPVPSLQDKFFYGDFVPFKTFMLDFNRDTLPAAFNGANGTLTEMTALWESLVMDPSDPNYTLANAGALFGIDHISSFGEDNAGNLYIVDFGHNVPELSNFNNQYPGPGKGEIFRITLVPEPAMLGIVAAASMLVLRRRRA